MNIQQITRRQTIGVNVERHLLLLFLVLPLFEENKQLGFKTFFVLIFPIFVIKEFIGTLIKTEELLTEKASELTVIASFRQKVIKESFGQK